MSHVSKSSLHILLILFLSNNSILALTDLTYLNCPSDYATSTANVSKSSQKLAKFFYSAFENDQYKQRVEKIVIEGKTDQLSAMLNSMIIPYIVVMVAFLIFFMIVTCCSVFQKSCPPCQSWKRDFTRRPYEKFQLRCVMIFTLIFATSIFILSIVMFTQFPLFKQNILNTKCSLYNMLDVTTNGQQSKQWGGFSQLKDQVGNISSLLTTASSQVNKNFKGFDGLSDDDWIVDDMEAMKKANLDLYRNNKDSKVTTPNPDSTDASPIGSPLPVIDSLFVKYGLGSTNASNTNNMVGNIDQSLNKSQTLSQQAYLIQKQSLILVDSAATIIANTNSSQQVLSMYQQQLLQVKSGLDKFSSEYFAKFFDWGLYVIEGVVGFILAGSVFILFGVISVHVLDIIACRTMVTLGWVIYSFTYFGIILLVFAFLSVGSIGYSFCNYFDVMISNKAQFNRIGQSYSQNVFTKLDVCLYGDGNVLQKFNIAQQMSTVTTVFTNIQTYYDYQNSQSVNYIDKTLSVTKIQSWIDAVEKYRIGVYKDSDVVFPVDDNPLLALGNLVKNTKYHYANGTLHPGCPKDVWVFDAANCTDPNAEVYQSTTAETNGMRFTVLNDMCISFNQKIVSTYSNTWNLNDFTKRYQQVIHTCPAYPEIIRYGRSIINYRNSRQSLFQGIKDSLISLKALNVQFNTNLNLYKSRVDSFYSSVSTLNNLVTDKISGLLVSSDCNVVGDYLKVTNNALCHNVMGQVVSMGICCILLLFVMIGGIITASVFSARYARIDNTLKHSTRIVIPQGSMMSETFQKKQVTESDSSSSSSDED